MSDLKYKVGDKVRIKSLDWYNRYTNGIGVNCKFYTFICDMKKYCGQIMTISEVRGHSYDMIEDDGVNAWTDEMIEGLVERNGKTYPYKIGDRVVLKGNNRCATITDLKYNSWGNLSYYIKIDNDKDISIDYPTDLLLPYDHMVEGLVEEEAKSHNNMCKQLIDEMNPNVEVNVKTPKFKIGDRVITDTNMKGKIIEVVEEGWYRVDFDDYNGISQPNGVVPEENMTIMTKETKPEPKFKVGDIIISDVFTTNDDKGWKVIDVERTGYKLISVNNSGLICDMDFKNEHYYKLVEEEMPLDKAGQITDFEYEGLAYTLPDGYQFVDDNGNVINAMKIVLKKKKKEYPKTYAECCKILGLNDLINMHLGFMDEDTKIIASTNYHIKTLILLNCLTKLRVCRDAYWKIAGEEMGLGGPWEPTNGKGEKVYSIVKYCGTFKKNLICDFSNCHMLEFPTTEMRDYFYENFKSLIEQCIELS